MPFKSCAERGIQPRKGYEIRPCHWCKQLVVHSIRTGEVLSSHRRSGKCRKNSARGA